jgi:hypothetical protein
MRRLSALVAVFLAGCAATPPDSPTARCDREALADPDVRRELAIAAGANNIITPERQNDINTAIVRARQACLRRAGIVQPGGGVEPVQRPTSLFSSFR